MYRVEIRIYQRTDYLRAYAELYEGEDQEQEPLMTAHTDTSSRLPVGALHHETILVAIREVCDELARNQGELELWRHAEDD